MMLAISLSDIPCTLLAHSLKTVVSLDSMSAFVASGIRARRSVSDVPVGLGSWAGI